MKVKIPDLIIHKAVDIWCKKLHCPTFDNGDDSEAGGINHALADINISNEKSKIPNMGMRIEKFRKVLTSELIRLRDNPNKWEYFPYCLDVDYSPCKLMQKIAEEIDIPERQFSCKSDVYLFYNKVSCSFGYGAPNINYYPLPDGKWLLTTISADEFEMSKIINSVMNGNILELKIED